MWSTSIDVSQIVATLRKSGVKTLSKGSGEPSGHGLKSSAAITTHNITKLVQVKIVGVLMRTRNRGSTEWAVWMVF